MSSLFWPVMCLAKNRGIDSVAVIKREWILAYQYQSMPPANEGNLMCLADTANFSTPPSPLYFYTCN